MIFNSEYTDPTNRPSQQENFMDPSTNWYLLYMREVIVDYSGILRFMKSLGGRRAVEPDDNLQSKLFFRMFGATGWACI